MSEHLQGPATFCAVFSGDTQILLMSRRGHANRDDLHQQGDVLLEGGRGQGLGLLGRPCLPRIDSPNPTTASGTLYNSCERASSFYCPSNLERNKAPSASHRPPGNWGSGIIYIP